MDKRRTSLIGTSVLFCCFAAHSAGELAGFVTEFLPGENLEERTANCGPWTEWGPCYGSETPTWLYSQPIGCYSNAHIKNMATFGDAAMSNVWEFTRRVNNSASECGMCNFQISCAERCTSDPAATRGTTNNVGVAVRVCDLPRRKQACAARSSVAYDPASGRCEPWPPNYVSRMEDMFPPPIPASIVRRVWEAELFKCISIDRKCYCCCAPYRPNPCTADCELAVCDERTVFTRQELIETRNKWLKGSAGFGGRRRDRSGGR